MPHILKILTIIFSLFIASCTSKPLLSLGTDSPDKYVKYQTISVSTLMNGDNDVYGKCDIKHNNFTYYRAEAPFTMRIRKSHHPLYITCDYDGFQSQTVKVPSQDVNRYDPDHLATTSTRWANEHHRPDWVYPSMINIPLNDFDKFYNHAHFYPDKTVPASVFLSRDAGNTL